MTSPYLHRAAAEIARGVEMTSSVRIIIGDDEYPLAAASWSLRLDEKLAPHARLEVECAIPDAELLDIIDPRREQYVVVDAGYVYADGVRDVHEYARLRLLERTIRHPAGRLSIVAVGREQDVVEAQVPVDTGWITTFQSLDSVGQIRALVATEFGAPFSSELPYGTVAPAEYPLIINPTKILDKFGYARSIADSLGGILYCDQVGQWRLRRAPSLSSSAAILTTGVGGTLVDVTDTLSREGWANIVYSSYEDHEYFWSSRADVRPGELEKIHHEIRKNHPQNASASATPEGEISDSANAGLLRRLRDRGAELTVDTIAHLWLKCHDTITVTTPDREQQRVLIAAITTTSNGLQTIRTRKPD